MLIESLRTMKFFVVCFGSVCICRCPKRQQTPDPPALLPCHATEENITRLEEFILKHFTESAFNCCEQQPLPLMKESPDMQLFADENAEPGTFHKAFPIPMHW